MTRALQDFAFSEYLLDIDSHCTYRVSAKTKRDGRTNGRTNGRTDGISISPVPGLRRGRRKEMKEKCNDKYLTSSIPTYTHMYIYMTNKPKLL